MKRLSVAQSYYADLFSRLISRKPTYNFHLVDFKNKQHKTDVLLSQTECNLEILPEGVMIVGNFTEKNTIIPVLKNEIESIKLVPGKEIVDTFYLSPMFVLSKLGIPNRISRFVKVYPSEYKITDIQITIKCEAYQLKLVTSGNRYEKLVRAFKKSGYSNEQHSILKPGFNLLQYHT